MVTKINGSSSYLVSLFMALIKSYIYFLMLLDDLMTLQCWNIKNCQNGNKEKKNGTEKYTERMPFSDIHLFGEKHCNINQCLCYTSFQVNFVIY